MTGADSLIRAARDAGLDVCFANPGTTEMLLVGALDASPAVRPVLGLFEGVCSGAADGYARMAGRPALTLLHLGPGLMNAAANLHNARRARTPIVNIVGDHASWHLPSDPLLTSDIAALAGTCSDWVRTTTAAGMMATDLRDAVRASYAHGGQVATLIVTADAQWGDAPVETTPPIERPANSAPSTANVEDAVRALRHGASTLLLLGGHACHGAPLRDAARVAEATGCRLALETFPARMDRGAGTPPIERFPYFPEQMADFAKGLARVVLAGARDPISMFAERNGASRLLPESIDMHTLATPLEDSAHALAGAASALDAPAVPRSLATRTQVVRPEGALDANSLATVLGGLLPDDAVLVDEGATTSIGLQGPMATAAPHSHLTLTGGAIGIGLPCATGAALACPDQKVVCLQADGSGLYTLQALWTQARESLDVTTVVCANRSYRILQIELARAGISAPGNASNRVTHLSEPAIDWTAVARGMGVDATRAETAQALWDALDTALREPGPHLIEALLP